MSTWEWKEKQNWKMIQLPPHSLTRGLWSHQTSMRKYDYQSSLKQPAFEKYPKESWTWKSQYHGQNEKLWVNMANKHQTRKEGQQHTQTWSLGPIPHKYCKCSRWRVWQYVQHPKPNQTKPPWHIIGPCAQYWHSTPMAFALLGQAGKTKRLAFTGQGTPPWASVSRV